MINFEDYGIQMWNQEKIISFRHTLLAWYDQEKRDLPWRRTTNPYCIWISEIMLQQTQVKTVIPYYKRFLETFPTLLDLAEAKEEELLKVWEGLGYYSRVRNMQIAARQIKDNFGGKFPENHDDILSLQGIGPYTAGAIASIAFNLPTPAVDGNVMRVMARLFEVNYDIGDPKNRKIFQAIMEVLIDPVRPGDFNQALMDLGTDIESAKTPRPDDSPIRYFSGAYLHGTMDKYPIKKPKRKPKPLSIAFFIIENEKGEFLLQKNTQARLLGGFWTFPLLEEKTSKSATKKAFQDIYSKEISWQKMEVPTITHIFSHQRWNITIYKGNLKQASIAETDTLKWVAHKDFHHFPFATPQKKVIEQYFKTIN